MLSTMCRALRRRSGLWGIMRLPGGDAFAAASRHFK
jgi:hypothetical protein